MQVVETHHHTFEMEVYHPEFRHHCVTHFLLLFNWAMGILPVPPMFLLDICQYFSAVCQRHSVALGVIFLEHPHCGYLCQSGPAVTVCVGLYIHKHENTSK